MAKNTHLEHLEDDILNNGSQGGKAAVAFLRSLGDMLSQGDGRMRVTTKWDGAPAIICGTLPGSNQFFVGNKSVFAKTTPKVCFNDSVIDTFYPDSGLNSVLKDCLKYLSRLNIKGVLQGDLLFTENTKTIATVGGKRCVVFQPNTITYAIPLDTELGQRVNASKIGIVFHTTYTGSSLQGMSAGFGVDVSPYQGNKDIAVFSSDFSDASGSANFNMAELRTFKSSINKAEGSLKQASKFLDAMVVLIVILSTLSSNSSSILIFALVEIFLLSILWLQILLHTMKNSWTLRSRRRKLTLQRTSGSKLKQMV